jgi:hypothetical protein
MVMDDITIQNTNMNKLLKFLFPALIILFSLNFGPSLFEAFTSDQTWASNPPESFYMFLGKYGHETKHYWMVASPIALLVFIICLIFTWKQPHVKRLMIPAFILFIFIYATTQLYFVPVQANSINDMNSIDAATLKKQADQWIRLNYIRNTAGFVCFTLILLSYKKYPTNSID